MIRRKLLVAAAAAAVSACEARIDPDEAQRNEAQNAEVEAEGKAEDGRISVKAPGLDLALDVPGGLAREARTGRDSKILYPGASIGGIHIAAAPAGSGGGQSEVDMRFSTPDPPDRVLAWYRDPARSGGFMLQKVEREGAAHLLTGVQARDKHPFKLRLSARAGGGTDGRLTVHHHD